MSGSPPPVPPDGPAGLIVLVRDDPDRAARVLADELGVELAVGGVDTAAALRRHTERADEEAPPASRLDRLADATRRAEAVGTRTRARVARSLARTINTELAIHPETLRRAAEELLAASAARAAPVAGRRPVALARTAAGGLAVAGIAVAGLVALPVGAAIAAVGVVGALAERAAARRAAAEALPALEAREALARRRWEQLAGVGTDPADAEAIAHRYDPQHEVVADLVGHHPAVRAADRATARHRAAWVEAWREELGDHERRHVPPASMPSAATLAAAPPADAVATLVVAAPYAGLSDERARELHQQLLTLPAGRRVVVVLGPDAQAHAERATVLDLRDRPRQLAEACGEAAVAPLDEVATGTTPPSR